MELELLEKAKRLLVNCKRYVRKAPEVVTCFDYVALKRSVEDHKPFWELIDTHCKVRSLSPVYARISRYNECDYSRIHCDTIPGVVLSCVIRLNEGTPRLVVEGFPYKEPIGKLLSFKPQVPHQVLPIPLGEERIVINFWMIPDETKKDVTSKSNGT